MDASTILVFWVFLQFSERYLLDDTSSDDAPMEIPGDAEKISNDALHGKYGSNGMSENISLFIHNGHIYVCYQSVDRVKIWQSIEIPHGWRVREDFQLVCYSWYNPDDDGFPQNLQILVSFDGGFLKLNFLAKSKLAHQDYNLVRLVNISVHQYFGLFDRFRGEQTTMHQYVNEESMFFVSVSRWNNRLSVCFEEYYFGDNFAQEYYKIVLPLSLNVKLVEYLGITKMTQWSFFNLWGRSVIPDFYCSLRVEMKDSQEYFSVKLSLIPPSDLENFLHDNDGLGVYKRDVNDRILGCEKSPGSKLCGIIEFLDFSLADPVPNERLIEIFAVTQNK
jgi:hypothetical protein